MSILNSIILGIVEGITEFLPISSTGHLILASSLLKIPDSESLKSFEIAIQLGAILAVLIMYFKEFLNLEVIKKIFVAFLPTAIIGLTAYKIVKKYLLGNIFVVIISLLIGGIMMILIENQYKKRHQNKTELDKKLLEKNTDLDIKDISYKKSLMLGFWQSLAIIPGISRSGATIIGGLLMNLKRETIVKFSFLLAVPTMIAATGLDLFKNYKNISSVDIQNLMVGTLVSFIVALIVIRWLLSYIQKHNFKIFGWYRILAAIVFFILFFIL